MTPRTTTILNQDARAECGFTATISDLVSGHVETHHRVGPPLEALRVFVSELDERSEDEGSDWRITSYSTPNTVAADLARTREGEQAAKVAGRQLPELYMLSRIGRKDRLDPSLRTGTSRAKGKRSGHAWRALGLA